MHWNMTGIDIIRQTKTYLAAHRARLDKNLVLKYTVLLQAIQLKTECCLNMHSFMNCIEDKQESEISILAFVPDDLTI